MLVVSARLTSDDGAVVVAALQQAQQEEFVSSRPCAVGGDSQGADDGADPDAISAADALVAMARSALASGPVDSSGDDQHLVILHADIGVFAGATASPDTSASAEGQPSSAGESLCRIENGPGVDLPTAERMTCDSAVVAVLHSARPGELLRLGRKTRKMSAALRRALRIRDGGCQFPGCHRRRHLQAHHVVHWMHGGPTDLDNLVLLCGRHHRAIHEEGFSVSWSADPGDGRTGGGWVFRRPDKVLVPFGGLDRLHQRSCCGQSCCAGPRADGPGTDPAGLAGRTVQPRRFGWCAVQGRRTGAGMNRGTPVRRTLVVWCPDWPAVAAARQAGHPVSDPVAVFHANRVQACTTAARNEGVHLGQRRRDAQSRCPDLHITRADPDRDARLFEPVAAAVETIAPGVEILRPGVIACSARGPARYFGSEIAAAEKIVDTVEALDVECRVGVADVLEVAVLAARSSYHRAAIRISGVLRTAADHRTRS